jgi:hypothetical protein
MKRLTFALPLVVACVALGDPGAAHDGSKVEIDHLDGSGTKTIIDVQPSIPGVGDLIRSTPAPIPAPGELIIAPTAVETPRPPTFTPHAF